MSVVISANYELEKGADFIQNITFRNSDRTPLNLTGYSASAKIRKYPTSPYYNTITVTFVNRNQGQIRLFISRDQTLLLASGRNYYDVMLTDPDGVTTKKLEGSILVNDSSTIGFVRSSAISDLGTIDTSNIAIGSGSTTGIGTTAGSGDGYVLMFDGNTQSFKFVNPDEVLSKAATEPQQPGLPSDFINQLDIELDNKIDIDAGTW
jgi:hypothetical protein